MATLYRTVAGLLDRPAGTGWPRCWATRAPREPVVDRNPVARRLLTRFKVGSSAVGHGWCFSLNSQFAWKEGCKPQFFWNFKNAT